MRITPVGTRVCQYFIVIKSALSSLLKQKQRPVHRINDPVWSGLDWFGLVWSDQLRFLYHRPSVGFEIENILVFNFYCSLGLVLDKQTITGFSPS